MRFRFKSADFTGKKSAQSAMEYLMTYGWAILVIAIVAALLFALGLFGNEIRHIALDTKTGLSYNVLLLDRIYRPGELVYNPNPQPQQPQATAASGK